MSSSHLDKFKLYISSLTSDSIASLPSCNYLTEQDFNASCRSLNNNPTPCNISMFHINIRSLNANHSKLLQLMITLDFNFDAIILSEVWAYNISMYKNLFPNYNFIYALPGNSSIGGIGAFIHNSFAVTERDDLKLNCATSDNAAESLFIELSKNSYHCIIGCIYRHPNSNISKFTNCLESILQAPAILRCTIDCFLIGDLNIDALKYDAHNDTSKFLDMLICYNFLPLFLLPTRITDTSATLIDHIFYRTNAKSDSSYLDKIFTGTITTDITEQDITSC